MTSSLASALIACGASPPPKAEAAAPAISPSIVPSSAAGAAGIGSEAARANGAPASESNVTATDQTKTPATETASAGSTPTSASTEPPAAEPKFFPIDVITGPEMAYLLDWGNSGAAEVAKKGCAGKPEEDPAKHADCLAKAREKFGGDVLRFKKDSNGHVKLTIFRRSGSALTETYSSNVNLKELNPHSVKVEIKGGVGQRPIMKDRGNFEIAVPNGYSLEIQDSNYGKLVYDAKVGLVAH